MMQLMLFCSPAAWSLLSTQPPAALLTAHDITGNLYNTDLLASSLCLILLQVINKILSLRML